MEAVAQMKSNFGRRNYCEQERAIMRSGFDAKKSDQEVVDELAKAGFHRSKKAINAHRIKSWLRFDPYQEPESKSRAELNRLQDSVFQRAMLRAIRHGYEHAPIGVYVDDSPLMPKVFHPQTPVSRDCVLAGFE